MKVAEDRLQPGNAVPMAAGDENLMRQGAVSDLLLQLRARKAELEAMRQRGNRLGHHKLRCAVIVPDMRMYDYFLK